MDIKICPGTERGSGCKIWFLWSNSVYSLTISLSDTFLPRCLGLFAGYRGIDFKTPDSMSHKRKSLLISFSDGVYVLRTFDEKCS
jgi:hypothetical protein